MDANLTILLIFLAVLAAACYAIRRLSNTPARVVAVLVALATLVGALNPMVSLLSEPQRTPAETVAPAMPTVSSASASGQPKVPSSVPTAVSTSTGR
ncbi:hypothetical protein [Streptomyces sp. NPDC060027]|uniref:hypothetical protein n=1 Tax=Streptomyces sp. NPDC060027 TaxID=3347040 RepID=UPI00369ECA06